MWDWKLSSGWTDHRQHHPGGNLGRQPASSVQTDTSALSHCLYNCLAELVWQIRLNLDLDPATLDTVPGFQEFLYLSQVYQATALQASYPPRPLLSYV